MGKHAFFWKFINNKKKKKKKTHEPFSMDWVNEDKMCFPSMHAKKIQIRAL